MDEAELGFNAWVLIGNVLNRLLRGETTAHFADASRSKRLAALDVRLQPVAPEGMLAALTALNTEDRAWLLGAVTDAVRAAGDDAETTSGLDREAALQTLEGLMRQEE